MLDDLNTERPVPVGDFDAQVSRAMGVAARGAVLLLEVIPPWPLQLRWLGQQLRVLAPQALVRTSGDSVLAAMVTGIGPAEAWSLQERLRDRARAHRMQLFLGVASWPVQGSTAIDVVAAAAATLLDEHARYQEDMGDEVMLDLDGLAVALGSAGELLTG
jgi:hypothetical protein